jgi:UDP-glucuronate 4-epimerase
MRVLVTGAAGFVGSRLSLALLARGDSVVGVDNLNEYYALEHKERHLADLLPHSQFSFVRADLSNPELLRYLLEHHRPEAIAHLGAMAAVRYSVQHPLKYTEVNVTGTVNLLDGARHIGNPRVVISSTGSVYGRDTPVPFKETACATQPLAPYPASKRAMELFAHTYAYLWQLPTTVVRFFNVYGPHGRPDMMPWQWTQKILKGEALTLFNAGHMKRDWTYIDDIVDGLVRALDRPQPFEIINLGCGNPVENLHFVRVLEGLLGRQAIIEDVPCPPSEPLETFADISKAACCWGTSRKCKSKKACAASSNGCVPRRLLFRPSALTHADV